MINWNKKYKQNYNNNETKVYKKLRVGLRIKVHINTVKCFCILTRQYATNAITLPKLPAASNCIRA
jgi:hypothetical protein